MKLDFRQAIMDDAGLLVDIYNASFFSDYQRFGTCPGYGKTIEMMEESIRLYPKHIILCDNRPVGCISCHSNHHAGAAPAQIGMKTEAAELPVFWYTTLERGTLQSTVEGVACNSSAAKAVFKSV